MTPKSAEPYLTNHFVDDTNVQQVINQVIGITPPDPFFEANPVKVFHNEEVNV